MVRQGVSRLLLIVSAVCLTLALLLASVFLGALDRSFYQKQYEKLGMAAQMGMSEGDLNAAIDVLLSYCEGTRDDIVLMVTVEGETREVFNEREKAHMVDVRALTSHAKQARNGFFVLFFVLLIAGAALRRWQVRRLGGPLLCGMAVSLLALGGIVAFAAINFDAFWTVFHEVLFTNDLWLLDSFSSLMINMLPQELFFDLVMRIVGLFAGGVAVCMALFGGLCLIRDPKAEWEALR